MKKDNNFVQEKAWGFQRNTISELPQTHQHLIPIFHIPFYSLFINKYCQFTDAK
jgi:hypothetical protein